MSEATPTQSVDIDEQVEAENAENAEKARLGSDDMFGSGGGGKPKQFWPSFKRLIGLLGQYKLAFIGVSVLGAIAVVLSVITPKVLGRATDIVFAGAISKVLPAGSTKTQVIAQLEASGQTNFVAMLKNMDIRPGVGIDFTALGQVLALALVLYGIASVLYWVQGYVVNVVMVKVMYNLREQVETKINALPLSYFDKVQRGELISRVTNDIENISSTMQQSLSQAISNVLTVIGVLIMMLSISWQLTLVVLVSFPLMAVIFGVIGPKSQAAFSEQWKRVGKLNARVEESFSGHSLVKLFGQEKATREAFAAENEELYKTAFKAQFLSSIMMPAMTFIGNLTYVGIAVFGAISVASGNLRLGSVQAFIQYSQQFTQPLSEIGGMMTVVQSGTASAERVFELLDEPDQSADNPDAPEPATGGAVEFEHVKFAYSSDQPLIEDLSFQVAQGQTVAIVGPTGAGKTTLVNLLMRFYELDGGKITVGGQDIASIKRHDVRARTGMVLQDPWLFSGTISDNIRFSKPDATDAEVQAAAAESYVDRFVHTLPDGYETVLDEDAANVSAGEKQLITIARAFLAKPSILILDEATSSVDTRTELLIQQAMLALRQGRTAFIIAHRLSTIRDADLILVMEHGQIVEQGNHAELIAARGAYFNLYNSQFKKGQV